MLLFHFLLTDEIIMAAPLRITDVTSGLLGGEDGRVYIYNGMYTTLGDMTGKCKSWMTPCPEEKVRETCGVRDGQGLAPSHPPVGLQLCWLPLELEPSWTWSLFTAGHGLSRCPGQGAKGGLATLELHQKLQPFDFCVLLPYSFL